MSSITFILCVVAMVIVYRHASDRHRYNRFFILIISLLFLFPALLASVFGWLENPRRKQGDDWRTAL